MNGTSCKGISILFPPLFLFRQQQSTKDLYQGAFRFRAKAKHTQNIKLIANDSSGTAKKNIISVMVYSTSIPPFPRGGLALPDRSYLTPTVPKTTLSPSRYEQECTSGTNPTA